MIPCWPALDFVSTSGQLGWHLHCPIHWLNADNIFDGHLQCGDIDVNMILEELRDGLPVVFSFGATDRRHPIFWMWLIQRTMPRLRCLEFELVVCSYWWYDVASYLKEVASILAESNIIYIHIRFRPISLYTPPVWWQLPQTFSRGLTDISRTYKDIPSLRYLSIDLAACDAQDSDLGNKRNLLREEPQWWRMFTVQSGDKVVSRIPSFIGEQIRERLHSPTYDCMQEFDDSEWFAQEDAPTNARAV